MPEQLGEIFRLQGGFAFKSADFQAIGVPVIKIADVTGGGALDFSSMQCVSDAIANQAAKFQPGPRDALIAMTGANVGRTTRFGQSDPVARINQRVGRFVPVESKGYSKDYAYYLVSSSASYEYFNNAAYGSAQPNISGSLIERLPIPNFQKGYANQIGDTLASFDNMIELNRRMNETLEAMAQALFEDWFVDFGPTRAKIEGRDPYLAPEIWDLFPDKLDVDGKPEGWEVFRLNQIAEHHTEVLSPAATPDTEFEHFSFPAFDAGRRPAIDKGLSIKSNKILVPKRAVLLSKLNPDILRVWLPEDPCQRQQIGSTEFLALVPSVIAGRALLFCLFSDDRFRKMLQSMVTGTSKSHQRISPKSLYEREVIDGNIQLFARFDELAHYLLAKTLANRSEAWTLDQARDLLLPKLMSGEIRVSDADKIVQEFT